MIKFTLFAVMLFVATVFSWEEKDEGYHNDVYCPKEVRCENLGDVKVCPSLTGITATCSNIQNVCPGVKYLTCVDNAFTAYTPLAPGPYVGGSASSTPATTCTVGTAPYANLYATINDALCALTSTNPVTNTFNAEFNALATLFNSLFTALSTIGAHTTACGAPFTETCN